MSLQPGQLIDNKYRIVRLIGEGGMGSVHEGQNTLIQRRVAIKVLHRTAAENEAALTRFEREAQAAGRIGSDHILEVLDLGLLPDGDRYMVMEYLDGEPLSARIQRHGRMTPRDFYPLLRQALVGLQAAHRAGIIHRDLKPDNIFILHQKAGHKDFVKIIDFGISKFNVLSGDMAMTRTGAVMGTPYYMSPEQAKGSTNIDVRSDLYSMGVIAYEALTGRVPFDGDTFNELMFKIALSTPPRLAEVVPDLDPAFVTIVEKMMARDVDGRYADAAELISTLDAWAQGGQAAHAGAAHQAAPAQATPPAAAGPVPAVGTASSWATSQADGIPKKSALPMVALAIGGVVVLAGGALAALALNGSEAPEGGAAAAASSTIPVVKPAAPPAIAPSAAESAKPEPVAAPEPDVSAAPEPAQVEKAEPERAAPVRTQVVSKPRVAVPTKPKPRATSSPTPAKPAQTVTKAKPREFGY